MPTYNYFCEQCDHEFESFQIMDEMRTPEGDPCPECNKKTVKLGITAPAIGDSLKLGITKLPGQYRERLKTMADNIPGNTIKVR